MTKNDDIAYLDDVDKSALTMYLNEIHTIPCISEDEENILLEQIKNGNKLAKDSFITYKLYLVVLISINYIGRGVPFIDLIGAGNIGLIKAIQRFDASKGYKFSTYATWWIKKEIMVELYLNGKRSGLSFDMVKAIIKYNMVKHDLEQKTNYRVTDEEIANKMGVSLNRLNDITKYLQYAISIEDLHTSTNTITYDNGDSLERQVELSCLKDYIQKLFKECKLSQIEIEVLTLRYGIGHNDVMTFEEIGKLHGTTREAVRRHEAMALAKLRISLATNKYVDYADNPDTALIKLEKYRERYREFPGDRHKFDPLKEDNNRHHIKSKRK